VNRNEAVDAAEDLLVALESLRRCTRQAETAVRRGMRANEQGSTVDEVFTVVDPAVVRESMNVALKAVEQGRHRLRLAVFAEALRAGVSIGELGRVFGFSRQLAARYARESQNGLVRSA